MAKQRSFPTRLVGNSFRPPAAQRLMHGASLPASVELVPEPSNPIDPCAVAVYFSETMVGYIRRVHAPDVMKMIMSGALVSSIATARIAAARIRRQLPHSSAITIWHWRVIITYEEPEADRAIEARSPLVRELIEG